MILSILTTYSLGTYSKCKKRFLYFIFNLDQGDKIMLKGEQVNNDLFYYIYISVYLILIISQSNLYLIVV